jgi:alkanesulfonate monooxygenase
MMTTRIKFMAAVRSGVTAPTAFVQQVNTVCALINGRISLNVVAGHTPEEQGYYGDFLPHDDRYARTDEFLRICLGLWGGEGELTFAGRYYRVERARLNIPFMGGERNRPEIYAGGNSALAGQLAVRHADCLWRLPDVPERVRTASRLIVEAGKETGLLVSILARPTREAALRETELMRAQFGAAPRQTHQQFAARSDSTAFKSTLALAEGNPSEWLTPWLWTGAVPYLGAPAIALVGSFAEVAHAIMEYKSVGVSQFLFMGWPDLEEMRLFSREVLPRVRQLEQAPGDTTAPAPDFDPAHASCI